MSWNICNKLILSLDEDLNDEILESVGMKEAEPVEVKKAICSSELIS